MSTEYEPFVGIGRRFDSEWRIEDFLSEHTYLTSEQITDMLEGGTHLGMHIMCLNCSNGQDWFVGFEVGGEKASDLIGSVADAHARWAAIFTVEPRVVYAVKIY
jgi:hypothetical protein